VRYFTIANAIEWQTFRSLRKPEESLATNNFPAAQRSKRLFVGSRNSAGQGSMTLESYQTLIVEINEQQFHPFLRSGYTFSMWRGDGQPYRNSQGMGTDVRNKRRSFVYPKSGMSPNHPLAQAAMVGWSWNDVFRAMHDLAGHAATGFTIPCALKRDSGNYSSA
jgi:hypothetical protein